MTTQYATIEEVVNHALGDATIDALVQQEPTNNYYQTLEALYSVNSTRYQNSRSSPGVLIYSRFQT